MAIFTIIVSKNRDVVSEKIKEQYPKGGYHETPDGCYFVKDSVTTREVCKKVGMGNCCIGPGYVSSRGPGYPGAH